MYKLKKCSLYLKSTENNTTYILSTQYSAP